MTQVTIGVDPLVGSLVGYITIYRLNYKHQPAIRCGW